MNRARVLVIVVAMRNKQKSLTGDLAAAVRSFVVTEVGATPAERLSVLEDEHRILSERRRRLHESIDLLDGLEVVKPDAAARLEKYRISEKTVSRRRRELYGEIGRLRSDQR